MHYLIVPPVEELRNLAIDVAAEQSANFGGTAVVIEASVEWIHDAMTDLLTAPELGDYFNDPRALAQTDHHAAQAAILAAMAALATRTWPPIASASNNSSINDPNITLAARTVALILDRNGYSAILNPASLEWHCEITVVEDINSLSRWLARRLERKSLPGVAVFPAEIIEPIRAFIAIPITDADPVMIEENGAASRALADVIAEELAGRREVMVTQPVLSNCDSPEGPTAVCRKDIDVLVVTDLLIVDYRKVAAGIGVVVARAVTSGASVLVLHPRDVGVTPMFDGYAGRISVIPYSRGADGRPDNAEACALARAWLRSKIDEIEQHVDIRSRRLMRWTPPLVAIRAFVGRNGPQGAHYTWAENQVEELIRSVDHLATGPAEIVDDLLSAAAAATSANDDRPVGSGNGRLLEGSEITVALTLGAERGWELRDTARLIRHVMAIANSGPTKLHRSRGDWLRMARQLGIE